MLSKEQAEKLTSAIKSNLAERAKLLRQAKDGRVWEVLGYTGFSEWLTEAVGITRARGYQLLDIADLEADLRVVATLPALFTVSDLSTRLIIKHGRAEFLEAVKKEATEEEEHNLLLIERLITDLRAAPTPPVVSITPKADDPDQLALFVLNNLLASVRDLPSPEAVEIEKAQDIGISQGAIERTIEQVDKLIADYSSPATKAARA